MNKLNLRKNCKLLAIFLSVLLVGCAEYVDHSIFEIETVTGEVIKLSCPAVKEGRSTITYLVDGQCIVVY